MNGKIMAIVGICLVAVSSAYAKDGPSLNCTISTDDTWAQQHLLTKGYHVVPQGVPAHIFLETDYYTGWTGLAKCGVVSCASFFRNRIWLKAVKSNGVTVFSTLSDRGKKVRYFDDTPDLRHKIVSHLEDLVDEFIETVDQQNIRCVQQKSE